MKTVNYLLRSIPPDLWEAVKIRAIQEHKSIRATILDLLRDHVFLIKKGK